ncbi:MAG: hypothetical protein ACI854_002376 [Arenicella sp.]|jgi:hypothetical protein
MTDQNISNQQKRDSLRDLESQLPPGLLANFAETRNDLQHQQNVVAQVCSNKDDAEVYKLTL